MAHVKPVYFLAQVALPHVTLYSLLCSRMRRKQSVTTWRRASALSARPSVRNCQLTLPSDPPPPPALCSQHTPYLRSSSARTRALALFPPPAYRTACSWLSRSCFAATPARWRRTSASSARRSSRSSSTLASARPTSARISA
eukprot:1957103-Prymnesium_polylepis.1